MMQTEGMAMSDDILEIDESGTVDGSDPLDIGIADKAMPVATQRRVGATEQRAIDRAVRHGWNLYAVGAMCVWLSRTDGKSPGTVYVDSDGFVGYCPF